MSFEDIAATARPNGSAGAPAMVPPWDARADTPNATPPSGATPPTAAADTGGGIAASRPIGNFAGTERRVLSRAELAALKAEARRHVEGSLLSQYEIARRLDLRPSLVSVWKRQEGWTRPDGAPVRPDFSGNGPGAAGNSETRRLRMIGRLYRVFDRQAGDLEARAAKPNATTDEKDARTLAVLAKTLETLIALDRDDGGKATKPESVNRGDYRAELARTLSRWAEEGEDAGSAD